MDPAYLFAYGTLRRDYGLLLLQELKEYLRYTSSGYAIARQYDLGSYPGAVPGTTTEVLYGDIYEISEPAKALQILDEYEGDEFKRELADINMASGTLIKAWVYWYTGKTENALQIEEKDYLNYLKNKKTVSYKWNIIQ
jgi:gamma-glutamylcyclotransferase (GGCT)/AIG2-like uncharacterized protein YtfP